MTLNKTSLLVALLGNYIISISCTYSVIYDLIFIHFLSPISGCIDTLVSTFALFTFSSFRVSGYNKITILLVNFLNPS